MTLVATFKGVVALCFEGDMLIYFLVMVRREDGYQLHAGASSCLS